MQKRPIALLGTNNLLFYRLFFILKRHFDIDIFDEKSHEIVIKDNHFSIYSFASIHQKEYGIYILLEDKQFPIDFTKIKEQNAIVCDLFHDSNLSKQIPLLDMKVNREELFSNSNYFVLANPISSMISRALLPMHHLFELEKINLTGILSSSGFGKKKYQELLESSTYQIHGKNSVFQNILPISTDFDDRFIIDVKRILNAKKLEVNPTFVLSDLSRTATISIASICKEKIIEKEWIKEIARRKELKYVPYMDSLSSKGKNTIFISNIKKDRDCEYTYNFLIHADILQIWADNIFEFVKAIYEGV